MMIQQSELSGNSQIKICAYSVMAMKKMQIGEHGDCGKPGDPGWPRRRELIAEYLASGDFDFMGLMHCQLDNDPKYNAVGWFKQRLQTLGIPVDYIAEPYGPDAPESGDSFPLFYNTERWQLGQFSWGSVAFETPVPAEDNISKQKGRHFIWGHFYSPIIEKSVFVYHLHLAHKKGEVADEYRLKLLREVFEHIQRRPSHDPVILSGDFNTLDEQGSQAHQFLREQHATTYGYLPLVDVCLAIDPTLEGRSRTQHRFKKPHDVRNNAFRNTRVLVSSSSLAVETAQIVPVMGAEVPSYAFPVEATVRFVS